jgi:chaperonin cofactor prefoldin
VAGLQCKLEEIETQLTLTEDRLEEIELENEEGKVARGFQEEGQERDRIQSILAFQEEQARVSAELTGTIAAQSEAHDLISSLQQQVTNLEMSMKLAGNVTEDLTRADSSTAKQQV